MGSDFKVDKPPFNHPNEQAHREQIARYTRDCLHKTGITPFNNLAGTAFTPPQLTTNQNDYEPGPFSILRLSSTTPVTITGFAEVVAGRFLFLFNVGSSNITLANESASSEAHHRIIAGPGGTVIGANDHRILWYDEVSERWRMME